MAHPGSVPRSLCDATASASAAESAASAQPSPRARKRVSTLQIRTSFLSLLSLSTTDATRLVLPASACLAAFRAIGLKRRSGKKAIMDERMFRSFDTDGDGKISPQEFEDNLLPDTRAAIEACLNKGFQFDPDLWKASA